MKILPTTTPPNPLIPNKTPTTSKGGWGTLVIPAAALIVILPLLLYGCSCGHDIDFHIQSWLEAANQLRHGTLQPHWAFTAAFNSGEPRFIFYPPLSWMFGALLTFLIPPTLLPAIYTFLILTAAGLAMHRLASHFVSPNAALLAATLYLANPYMLFNAFERTAYAELLAAVWLPLLFLAVLRARPTIQGIALPLALLWLTNAPAAVMGSYTLALIILTRILLGLRPTTRPDPTASPGAPGPDLRTRVSPQPLNLALTSIAGTTLGLALAAFYLIPAAYERRFVQIAMAIIANMRFQDNFLFGHTADAPHNQVLHTASILAVSLLIATIAALTTLWFRSRTSKPATTSPSPNATQTLSSRPTNGSGETRSSTATTLTVLITLTLLIAFLLTPISTPLWTYLPELAFLQFPWRLLSVLAVVLALALALLFRNTTLRTSITLPLTLALAAPLTFLGIHQYRQPCDAEDLPAARAQLFATHHGVDPTDEYTPINADNDVLRSDDPPYWLSPNPAAFAPGTTPNPATFIQPQTAPADTKSATRATHTAIPISFEPVTITVNAPYNTFLILNLRDYPNWDITRDDPNGTLHLPHVPRDDGLIAIPIQSGLTTLHIAWHRTLDEQLGLLLSALALAIYATLSFLARSRRIEA